MTLESSVDRSIGASDTRNERDEEEKYEVGSLKDDKEKARRKSERHEYMHSHGGPWERVKARRTNATNGWGADSW